MLIDPARCFQGKLVLVAPHMDDDVLACGGTIAQLPQKERIHVVYATDGMASPAPVLPWRDSISPDLGAERMREARTALAVLGIPDENIHFLGLPEGQLKSHVKTLSASLSRLIVQLGPDHILTPFRYDRHADHLALNQVVIAAYQECMYQAELTEYFVYYRWRLLPTGDIRRYIHPQHLFAVNIEAVSAQKRTALDCFKSQTTRFYAWQHRPNLTNSLLDEVSRMPELFLKYNPSFLGTAIFTGAVPWIRLVHRSEPYLKRRKDAVIAVLNRVLHWNDRKAR